MRPTLRHIVLIAALAIPSTAFAQETNKAPVSAPAYFKLVYRLLQVDESGKVASSRSYSAIISTEHDAPPSMIRNNEKIPIVTTSGGSTVATQYQYQDVGTDIDTRRPVLNGQTLSFQITANTSSLVKTRIDNLALPPVMHYFTWNSTVVVPLNKPTIIFSSQNTSDTGKTELELTATPIREP